MKTIPDRLLFGTAGVPQTSPQASTLSGIRHILTLDLDCLEVEFVQGVKMGMDTAGAIYEEAKKIGIALSVHAPYYISLNSPEEGIRLMSQERLLRSARVGRKCGAQSVVFHPGYYGKNEPEKAYENIKQGIQEVNSILRSERNPIILRPETMGKKAQFGTLEEVLLLCQEIDGILPCIDFSHLYAREGKANSYLHFHRILTKVAKKLGDAALKNMHIHISGTEYNKKGEIKHLNLHESDFRFDDWIQALKDFDVAGKVICESPQQENDAIMLKKLYYGT